MKQKRKDWQREKRKEGESMLQIVLSVKTSDVKTKLKKQAKVQSQQ